MKIKSENDFQTLLLKAERFCAYQERCSFEVRQKLKEFNADDKTIELILSSLRENDFQNDERFAILFSSGKFRIKKWGKNKIRAELRTKNIPDSLIRKGLDAIHVDEYAKTIEYLAKKKQREIKAEKQEIKNQKIGRYLLSKGFESDLIWKILKRSAFSGTA